MKILTIQDISCYGSCSCTVALPILSALGHETIILPSAILSNHTTGFKEFTCLDLTDEMPKIVQEWEKLGLKFDAIYTGYIGDKRQFDLILEIKKNLLKKGGLFIVDPAMADHGKLYPALNEDIVKGMKKLVSEADLILPNITEAALLTDLPYEENQTDEYIDSLIKGLKAIGAKNIVLTSLMKDGLLGAFILENDKSSITLKEKEDKSYHGSGDIFSSVVIGNYLNGDDLKTASSKAADFIIKAIKVTDEDHWYGLQYEKVLNER